MKKYIVFWTNCLEMYMFLNLFFSFFGRLYLKTYDFGSGILLELLHSIFGPLIFKCWTCYYPVCFLLEGL